MSTWGGVGGSPSTCTREEAPLFVGILQARILKWAPIPSSRGSSQPINGTHVPGIADGFFTV